MGETRIAVFQMTSGIDPLANAAAIADAARQARNGGASMLFTPEMCGLLDRDRKRAAVQIVPEADNPVLATARGAAQEWGLWIALGSLAIERGDGRCANRSLLIAPDGTIAARYDKIHMFDVQLPSGENWHESAAYAGGDTFCVVDTPLGALGLSICYDLRFPELYRQLARAGARVLLVPAAFTAVTGEAHWEPLLRARAIENQCYVVAANQGGTHETGRQTWGHSMVIDPWGQVMAMQAEGPSVVLADIDLERLRSVREQLPSLQHRRL